MKTLYIECNMGAAGDMLTAALSELLPDPDSFVAAMNAAGIPGLRMARVAKSTCGILGTHMRVEIGGEEELCPDLPEGAPEAEAREFRQEIGHEYEHDHVHEHEHAHEHDHDPSGHHHQASPANVCAQIDGLNLPEEVRARAKQAYDEHEHDQEHAHDHDPSEHHHQASPANVCAQIDVLNLPEEIRAEAKRVYDEHAHDQEHAHDHDPSGHHHQASPANVCAQIDVLNLPEEVRAEAKQAYYEHAHEHDHEHAHDHAPGGHHHHASLAEVCAQIDGLNLPEEVRAEAKRVYALLAEAEAHVHGCDAESLHFHEVGMLDAITDVCAVCLELHLLQPERVVVSPIHTGFGQVRCAHGVLPVPTPATAYILRDMPASAGSVRGELLTPTGAALLKHFATEYGWMPAMRTEKIGCGVGTKEFPAANCVRAFLGDDGAEVGNGAEGGNSAENGDGAEGGNGAEDGNSAENGDGAEGGNSAVGDDGAESGNGAEDGDAYEIRCNLDDMTGEAIGFAAEELMKAGALDVWLTPIQMKKGRPGVQLNCLCRPEDRRKLEDAMLRHTTSIGVRGHRVARRTLPRKLERVDTPYGEIGIKRSAGEGFVRVKPEYEDAAEAARRAGVPLAEVLRAVERNLPE